MSSFTDDLGRDHTYESIRNLMDGPFKMKLAGLGADAVQASVNQGIDAHLEACFIQDRGDSYKWLANKLDCVVSEESLPVLLRRLFDSDDCDAWEIACGIIDVLKKEEDDG